MTTMPGAEPSQDPCPFTYDHYREILHRLRDGGARFAFFGRPTPRRGRLVWLRHDVDLDPEATLPLAEMEAAVDAPATYLFQITSPFYNPLAPDTARIIRRLRELGHEVGLHLNLHAYAPGAGPIAALVRQEAEVLKAVTGAPVRVVSYHRPTPDVLGRAVRGFVSTYAAAYFRRSKYLSDSGMRWREGCACRYTGIHDRLQILTHGEWWAAAPGDRMVRLARYREQHHDLWEAAVAVEMVPREEDAYCPL